MCLGINLNFEDVEQVEVYTVKRDEHIPLRIGLEGSCLALE